MTFNASAHAFVAEGGSGPGRRHPSPRPFDDRRFPCAPPYLDTHDAACRRGKAAMAGARVVVCGLARDVARELPDFIARMDQLARRFADLRVVIYENDSLDDTPAILAQWAAREPRVTVQSERRGDPLWRLVRDRARTEQLAGYRNCCREIAVERFGDFDFMLVTDLDLDGWSLRGIENSFGQDDWDVIGANGLSIRGGRPIYYDTWAFRSLGHPHAHRNSEVNLMVFPRGAPALRVGSCFGGLAIYRMEAMLAADYGGEDCEHVVLHTRMAEAGFDRVFLNPSLIVRYPDHARISPSGRGVARWWTVTDPFERHPEPTPVDRAKP